MKVTGKTRVRNRFDIICQDIVTGEEQRYQAHNIVLNQMFTRLVNFQSFFTAIHFGTGTGTLSPTRTSLFSYSGAKSATTVEQVRELPTSHWMRQIVLQPSEYVDHELTEIGVGYSTSSSSLVTHAFIEDSEGNPIDEADIYDRYANEVLARSGVRELNDDSTIVGQGSDDAATMYLPQDQQFTVESEEDAQAYVDADPTHTHVWFDGEWHVLKKAGAAIIIYLTLSPVFLPVSWPG